MIKLQSTVLLVLVLSLCSVAITYSSWVSPNETGNDVVTPLHIGNFPQTRLSNLGLTSGSPAPSGAPKNAIDLYNGSLFVRNGGYNPNNWTASSDFTIDTPNVIASHGVTSAGNIQATRFLVTDDLSGGVSSKRVCANEQGKLVLCAVTVNPDPVLDPTDPKVQLILNSDSTQYFTGQVGYAPCAPGDPNTPQWCETIDHPSNTIQISYSTANATSCSASLTHVSGPNTQAYSFDPYPEPGSGFTGKYIPQDTPVTMENTAGDPIVKDITNPSSSYQSNTGASDYNFTITCMGSNRTDTKSVTTRIRTVWQ